MDRSKVAIYNKLADELKIDSVKPSSRIFGGKGESEKEFPIYLGDDRATINGAEIKDRKYKELLLDGSY